VNKLMAALVIFMMIAVSAAAEERPIIADAEVYVSGDRIVCDVRCDGLLSERIAGTVQSGLPAVIELLYSVEARDGKAVSNGIHSYELLYDVWDDIYSIRSGDSTVTFEDFDAMGRSIERLQRVPLVSVAAADTSREYSVSLTVAVHPLRGSETRRVEGLVSDAVGARSHDSWREQVLNINDLISRFFSRDKGTSNRSDVYRTQYFAPRSLPGAGGSSGGGSGGGGSSGLTVITVAFEVR
jgi:hypothetical protein